MANWLWSYKLASAGGSGILYYSTNYNFVTSQIDKLTNTNAETVETQLENLTRTELWDFDSPIFTTIKENEQSYRSARCGRGIYARTELPKEQLTFNRQDVWDLEARQKFQNAFYQITTSAPISIADPAQELLWTNASVWQVYRLSKKNADGSAIPTATINVWGTINADWVTVTWGTALVSGTDFELLQDTDGSMYITFLTAQTGVLSAEYTYTPANKKYSGYNFEAQSVPFVALKFVSCDRLWYDIDDNINASKWVTDTVYVAKASLTGDFAKQYYNLDNETFEGSPVEFLWEEGWLALTVQSEIDL